MAQPKPGRPDVSKRRSVLCCFGLLATLGRILTVGGGGATYYTRIPGGHLVGQRNASGAWYYYLFDGLGSIVEMVDTSQNIVARYGYDPYGQTVVKTGSAADGNPWRYTGAYLDSTGLYKMGARYYDAARGRFTQLDPLGGGYVYASDNPVNFVDSSGLKPQQTPGDDEDEEEEGTPGGGGGSGGFGSVDPGNTNTGSEVTPPQRPEMFGDFTNAEVDAALRNGYVDLPTTTEGRFTRLTAGLKSESGQPVVVITEVDANGNLVGFRGVLNPPPGYQPGG